MVRPFESFTLVLAFIATGFAAARESQDLAPAVQPFIDQQKIAGAVLAVANADGTLVTETAGWANREEDKEMEADSMFWIASQSKPITAAAFMILVDEGKVSLNDPVEKFLPEFAIQMVIAEKSNEQIILTKPLRPITVRDILSHCSGLPFKSALEAPTLDLYSLAARTRSYAMTPLENEPGTHYQYSNAGINTAGRIIEVLSGQSFEDFLRERLFEPLGMEDTTFWPNEDQAERIALSYRNAPEGGDLQAVDIEQLHYPLTDQNVRRPMPAGGLFSTADNVIRFYRMLAGNGVFEGKRILSEESVASLTTKQTPDEIPNGYGLGFAVTPQGFGHAGAYGTNTTCETDSGLIHVWLVQHAGPAAQAKEAQAAFREAAMKRFAGGKP